jgi:hypothetical protein
LVPYVGFVAKAAISGIMIAQILVLYAAGDAGAPPRIVDLWRGFLLPLSSQVALALTAFLPFAAGVVFLTLVGKGNEAVAVFFGHILSAPQLDPDLFFVFKAVLYIAGIPMTFVSAAVAIAHLAGARSVFAGFSAAGKNLPVLAAMLLLSIVFELAMRAMSTLGTLAGAVSLLVILPLFLTWNFAFEFAVATRVFGAER